MKNLAFPPSSTASARFRNGFVGLFVTVCCGWSLLIPASGDSEPATAGQRLTGKPLVAALQQRRSLNVSGSTLRSVVGDLQNSTHICVCIDRRTNPSARIEVKSKYVTTKKIFEMVAAASDAAVSFGDDLILVGPEASTRKFRTVIKIRRQEILALRRKMEIEKYRRLVEVKKRSWSDLAEPRELLLDAAVAAGVQLENPDVVPHDLWAGLSLPALPLTDFVTLVLHQFDLTFELSAAGTMKFVSVPAVVEIEERYRVTPREKQKTVQQWTSAFPDLNVTWKGSTALVSATVETHERLREIAVDKSKEGVAAAGIRSRLFAMKVPQGTLFSKGKVIDRLRASGVPIRIQGRTNAELEPLLRETVQFDISKTRGDEFFPLIFDGWGAEVAVGDDEVLLSFP